MTDDLGDLYMEKPDPKRPFSHSGVQPPCLKSFTAVLKELKQRTASITKPAKSLIKYNCLLCFPSPNSLMHIHHCNYRSKKTSTTNYATLLIFCMPGIFYIITTEINCKLVNFALCPFKLNWKLKFLKPSHSCKPGAFTSDGAIHQNVLLIALSNGARSTANFIF